jgi:hypothetical protein
MGSGRVFLKFTNLLPLGVYKKPSLLAQPDPLVKGKAKVTLQCNSEIMFETFILVLYRQKVIEDPLNLSGESYDGGAQANVSIGPVTPVYAGTYICYRFLNHQPYVWSEPSDPVDIAIIGECPDLPLIFFKFKITHCRILKSQVFKKPNHALW